MSINNNNITLTEDEIEPIGLKFVKHELTEDEMKKCNEELFIKKYGIDSKPEYEFL